MPRGIAWYADVRGFDPAVRQHSFMIIVLLSTKAKINICVFQVSRPYLGFCPDPKHFIVNCEQNVVKFAGKWGKMY